MNIYRHQFVCTCPANAKPVIYNLEIQSQAMIYVEKIVQLCGAFLCEYHERIADALSENLPGTVQFLRADHHGVSIETIRGRE